MNIIELVKQAGASMTDHWCKYCNGTNTHNCQFNPNLPRMKIYTNTAVVSDNEALLHATEVMGLPGPANRAGLRAGLIEPTRSFAIAAQQARR